MNSNKCSACKVMKYDCTHDCILAPYFPLTNLESFERLHRIFGATNVFKILANLEAPQRETAVRALCYEAEARERDHIHGYVGIFQHYQEKLTDLKDQINSTKKEFATISGPDRVPHYLDLPMPDDFLTTQDSLESYIEFIKGLNEVQKNELMQLPPNDAKRIMSEMFRNREHEKMYNSHGDGGASTSAGPSTTLGSTSTSQKTFVLPQNQNQP